MFKTFTNLFKSDNAKWLFVAIVLCIVAYSLLNYSNGKGGSYGCHEHWNCKTQF